MSLLHGNVEGFKDGVCERVMWGVFRPEFSPPDGPWSLRELYADIAQAQNAAAVDSRNIVQAVKVRIDLRGAQ